MPSREGELREEVQHVGYPAGREEREKIEEKRGLCPSEGGGFGVQVALACLVAMGGRAIRGRVTREPRRPVKWGL